MADVKVKIGADASEFSRVMKGVRGDIGQLRNMIGGLVAGAAAIYGVTKAVSVIGSQLAKASEKAADMEMLQMSFETLTGSAETAKDLIATFRKEAQKSPLTTRDYAESGKKLLGFGLNMEDLIPTLKMLGDVSLGNADRFSSLSLAFAQTTAAGRLMGQEVLQFVNAGFNPLQAISKKTGESMFKLKKRMEDGGISAADVADAFRGATSEGGMFFNAIEKGAATMQGKIAATKDTVDTLYIAFGEGMNEGLKVGLDAINSTLPIYKEKFAEIGSLFGRGIADAAEGDLELFKAIGNAIGVAVWEGVKLAFKSAQLNLGEQVLRGIEQTNPLRKVELFNVAGKMADYVKDGKGSVMASEEAQAMQAITDALRRIQLTNIPVAGGASFRPAGPGEESQFRDSSGRMVILLESINNKLTSSAFPN